MKEVAEGQDIGGIQKAEVGSADGKGGVSDLCKIGFNGCGIDDGVHEAGDVNGGEGGKGGEGVVRGAPAITA